VKPFDLGPYKYDFNGYMQLVGVPLTAAGVILLVEYFYKGAPESFKDWRVFAILAGCFVLFSLFRFVLRIRQPQAFQVQDNRLIAFWWRRSSEFQIPDLLLRQDSDGLTLSDGITRFHVSPDLVGYHEFVKLLRAAHVQES